MEVLLLLILVIFLIGMSALFSGLTLGLISLSVEELRRKAKLGDPDAQLVYPLRAKGYELLVTLIVINVVVNAAITILLDSLLPTTAVGSLIALILATIIITIFGEILPQAYLRKHGLRVGASIAPYLRFLMEIMRPISKPLASMIEKSVGVEVAAVYSNDELLHIIGEHVSSNNLEIEADELVIVRNALAFGEKLVDDIMTPRSVFVAVEENEVITTGLLSKLQASGNSRIPVYKEHLDNIVGILYMHKLVGKQKPGMTAGQAMSRNVYFVQDQQHIDHVLNAFIKTRQHLFIVTNEFEETVGLVTLEDVTEAILGRKIVDEFDRFDDMRAVAALTAKQRRSARTLVGGKKG